MRFYLLALACSALLLASQALVELSALVSTRKLAQELDAANQRGDDIDQEMNRLRSAVIGKRSEDNTLAILARIEQAAATETNDGARQVKLLCAALSTYGLLVKSEPLSGPYLVNWANVRQILSKIECREEYTSGDASAVVALARKNDPTNISVTFAAAQLALWNGNRDQALDLFRTALELGTGASAQMEHYILQAISTPQDMLRVIPGRFPYVLRWSKLVLEGHPERQSEYRHVLATLQQGAISHSLEDLKSEQVSKEIVNDWLSGLSDLVADSATRQLLDQTIAQQISDRAADTRAWRDYLRQRSNYVNLSIVSGMRLNDTQPQKSALASWGRRGALSLDENFTSIGAYIAKDQSLHFLQLQAFNSKSHIDPAELHIRISDDNENWRELEVQPSVRKISTGARELLVFEFQGLQTRYLKVTFERPIRRAQFNAALPQLLTLYGNSMREEE